MTRTYALPDSRQPPAAVADALSGKTILLTGVTGLVGQLVLFTLLREYPRVGRVLCLVRSDPQDGLSPGERLTRRVFASPIFTDLRVDLAARGFDFDRLVEAVPGEFGPPRFGWDDARWQDVARQVDIIVNCAGLVAFNGPLDAELSANIDGPLELAALAEAAAACGRQPPALCHMSTCFVSGTRDGRAQERAPHIGGGGWESVLAELRGAVRRVTAAGHDARTQTSIRRDLQRRLHLVPTERQIARQTRRWISDRLAVEAKKQAQRFNWPNIYTLTKALGELSLAARSRTVPTVVVRPSIVGAAHRHPRGWLDGADSITPVAGLILRGHRLFPIRRSQCLDVIPVDMVVNATIAIAAMASTGTASGVYQLCSGPDNACAADRLLRLTHREVEDVLSQEGAPVPGPPIAVPEWLYRALTWPLWERIRERLGAGTDDCGRAKAASDARVARSVIDAYAPFLYRHRPVFESHRTMALYDALSEADRARLPFDPRTIDWDTYWVESQARALFDYGFPRSGLRRKPVAGAVEALTQSTSYGT